MEKLMCVYQIVNLKNKKRYIGSTIDFKKRRRNHFRLLKKGNHHSLKLQNSFNKYGEENFIMETLEIVLNVNDLIKIEQKWIDELTPELNMTFIAGKNTALGRIVTEETKEKIRNALTGKKLTEEHIAACIKGREDYVASDATKEKMSKTHKERWSNISEEEIKVRSEKVKSTRLNNGGYVVTEGMKQQISTTLKNKENYHGGNHYKVEKYSLDNILIETYPSMVIAEKINSIGKGYLSKRLKEDVNLIKGFIWKIKKDI